MINEIKDLNKYNEQMRATIADKMDFLKHIPLDNIDTIIDFGCADGSLDVAIEEAYPDKNFFYILIDNDKEMLARATENVGRKTAHSLSLDSLDKLGNNYDYSNAVLVMNSVIHEIFSYYSPVERIKFWERLNSFNFAYIAIRDMHDLPGGEPLPVGITDFYKMTQNKAWHDSHTNLYSNILEFLLTYSYTENLEREREEIYLWDWSHELGFFLTSFKPDYVKPFNILYLIEKWHNDFGIDMSTVYTHKSVIFKKKG